jgi:hypothetical protein
MRVVKCREIGLAQVTKWCRPYGTLKHLLCMLTPGLRPGLLSSAARRLGLVAARISAHHRNRYDLMAEGGATRTIADHRITQSPDGPITRPPIARSSD